MEEMIKVLDKGYVTFVEAWGSDERIIEAARMSTQKGFEGWGPIVDPCQRCGKTAEQKRDEATSQGRARALPCDGVGAGANEPCDIRSRQGDEKLLAYLWKNAHATPFEMAGLIVEVQAPIFVFREWHRHRTQSFNEASARYAPLPAFDYVPTRERVLRGGGHLTKQAGGVAEGLTADLADQWLARLEAKYAADEEFYRWGLSIGVPKELARVGMPVGRYSRMRASCNLRNWLGFMTLRAAPNAQWEIQEYARAVGQFLERQFPRTFGLWEGGAR